VVEVELDEEEDLEEAEDDGGNGWMGNFVSKDTPHLLIAGKYSMEILFNGQSGWSNQKLWHNHAKSE
jgi:hypothetical protein